MVIANPNDFRLYIKYIILRRFIMLIQSHCGAILSTASKLGTKPIHKYKPIISGPKKLTGSKVDKLLLGIGNLFPLKYSF